MSSSKYGIRRCAPPRASPHFWSVVLRRSLDDSCAANAARPVGITLDPLASAKAPPIHEKVTIDRPQTLPKTGIHVDKTALQYAGNRRLCRLPVIPWLVIG
jgi:hypothetical protein